MYLGSHEGDGAQQLALELPGPRALGRQAGGGAKVGHPQPVAGAVDEQVGPWSEHTKQHVRLEV